MQSGGRDRCYMQATSCVSAPRGRWREIELLLLTLLVLGIYFSRLTDLTIRGEESRWARVAQEMIETGDWIVPRQQGEPFPDRPPLNSWAMIVASQLTGQLNLVAIRLPAVLATLLTTLLVYLYTRNFLSRVGAFAAGAAYCTMIQVLQLGRLAESDSLLTLCVAASLFCWHWGYSVRGNPGLAWVGGYALAAMAGLAKGPQGPIYFLGITTVYLAVQRDWRFLSSRWNLAGLGIFTLILGAWQLPFLLSLDAASAQAVWSEGGDFSTRFQFNSVGQALGHWASYPFEVFACMLPWAFLLPVFASPWFRRTIGEARPMVGFLLTACAVAFPTCWLPVESRARYFMSLYPCVAPLFGLVVQRSWEAKEIGWWQRSWDRFLLASVAGITCVGLTVGIGRMFGGARLEGFAEYVTVPFTVSYVIAAIVAAASVLWSRTRKDVRHVQTGIFAVAGFIGLSYTGIIVSLQLQTSNDPSAEVASVRQMIPNGQYLVSFGPVHHLFAYYYQQSIELEPLVDNEAPVDTMATYFCFAEDPSYPKTIIPFDWQPIAEISCERARSQRPLTKVIVGKRTANLAETKVYNEDLCNSLTPVSPTTRRDAPPVDRLPD